MAPLTSLERRVIGNLAIPRNTLDLERTLRADVYAAVPEFQADDVLAKLKDDGFVVNVGRHDSPGKAAAHVDSHKRARNIAEESVPIYEARLTVPHRSWRAKGELWIMTDEGFAKLHDPEGVGDPTPLPTQVVEQLIQAQLARVHNKAKLTDSTTLGDKLLKDEFVDWVNAVADAHQEATGERPTLPIAGGAGYSDATELLILDPENAKGSAYTEASPWYMAAVTVAVTDVDTGSTITEANYTGYARKSVAAADMNSAAAGAATNANAITFAACSGGTSAVIGFAKCVAATVGRLIKYGTCSTVNVSSTQQPLNFAVAAFTTSLD